MVRSHCCWPAVPAPPRTPRPPPVLAACGAAAAVSAIFGNPLVAAVLFLELLGLGRRAATLVLLPCLVASGVGALVFTGLGRWTGLDIGSLAIPDLGPTGLRVGDVLWTVPIAAVVAALTWAVFGLGRRVAESARTRLLATTVGAGVVAATAAMGYGAATDRSPTEVVLSGQATLGVLAAAPSAWSTGALVLLVLAKGLAYAVCLGAFRGGAVFPAIFLGAAVGVVASTAAPGLGAVPALAAGMAAGVAVLGLPVTSILLVVLLLGEAAGDLMPVVILAAVTAFVVEEALTARGSPR
ncbi:chloride channel protein [Nocardioides sp. CCNWLW212]